MRHVLLSDTEYPHSAGAGGRASARSSDLHACRGASESACVDTAETRVTNVLSPALGVRTEKLREERAAHSPVPNREFGRETTLRRAPASNQSERDGQIHHDTFTAPHEPILPV